MCGSSERKFGVVNHQCQQQSHQKIIRVDRSIDLTLEIATRSSEVFFVNQLRKQLNTIRDCDVATSTMRSVV